MSTSSTKQYTKKIMRHLNQEYVFSWPWFIGGFLLLTVLCASAYGLRTVNRANMASQILETSNELEANGDYDSAIKILSSFLDVNINTPEVWSKICALLGKMYEDKKITTSAMLKKSIQRQKDALAFIPTESSLEVRERILQMEYDLAKNDNSDKSMVNAIFDADEILKTWKNHPLAKRILALGVYSNFIANGAMPNPSFLPLDELLRSALNLNPSDIDLAVDYARFLRSIKPDWMQLASQEILSLSPEERNRRADDIINTMVTQNATNARAYLERYVYRADNHLVDFKQEDLDSDLVKALEHEPQSRLALRLAGQLVNYEARLAQSQGQTELATKKRNDAFEFFSQLIKHYPGDPEGYLQLGRWYLMENQADKALEIWKEGRNRCLSLNPELYAQNAYLFIEQKKYEDARELIRPIEQFWVNNQSNLQTIVALNLSRILNLLKAKVLFSERTDVLVQRQEYLNKINEAKLNNIDVDPSLYKAVRESTEQADQLRVASSQLIKRVIDGLPELEYDMSPSILSRLEGESFILYGRMQADIGEWEKAAENFNKARAFPAFASQATLMAADAYDRCNQPEKASALLNEATRQYSNNPQIRMAKLNQLFKRETAKPNPLTRNYEAIETELNEVAKIQSSLGNPWEVDLLRIRFHYFRDGGTLQAQQKMTAELEKLEKDPKYNTNVRFLSEVAALYSGLGALNDFNRVVEQLHKAPGGEVPYYLEKIRDAQRRNNIELALQYIDEALSKLPENERPRFVQIKEAIENHESIVTFNPDQQYERLMQEYKDNMIYDPQTFFELGLLALSRGDMDLAKTLEDRLKKIEGENEGSRWRFLACRRLIALWQARGGDSGDELLINARALQQDVARLRPNWDMTFVLQAELEKAVGNRHEAVAAYQTAIEKGTRQQSVYRDLISLYYSMNRPEEGSQLRSRAIALFGSNFIQEDSPFPAPYQGYYEQIYVAINEGNIETATNLAKDCIRRAVTDKAPTDLILDLNMQIGRLFFSVNQNEVAEQFLAEVAKLGGTHIFPLAVCYVRMERVDDAFRLFVQEIKKGGENNPAVLVQLLRLYTQAQPSEKVLQELDEQLIQHESQFTKKSETILILADYWIKRKRLGQAIALYQKGLEADPNHLWMLNNLAMLLTEQALGNDIPFVQTTFGSSGAKRIDLPKTTPQKSYIFRFPDAEKSSDVPKTSDFRFLAQP